MVNPFTDELTPSEERIVDYTLKHLRKNMHERIDAIRAKTAAKIGREITEEELERQICRVYLSVYREAWKRGRRMNWQEIHDQIGRKPTEDRHYELQKDAWSILGGGNPHHGHGPEESHHSDESDSPAHPHGPVSE